MTRPDAEPPKQTATIEKLKPRPPKPNKPRSINDDGFERGSSRHILLQKLELMAQRILPKTREKQLTRKGAVPAPNPGPMQTLNNLSRSPHRP